MKRIITAKEVLRYAHVSKDDAAIHVDEQIAKQAGFERPIVHGMYIMGLAQSLFLQSHPTTWITNYTMRFQQPLLIGEEVTFYFEARHHIIDVFVATETSKIALGTLHVKEFV